MREELDNILRLINEPVLTQSEWEAAEALLPPDVMLIDEYNALLSILEDRGGEGNAVEKLRFYFKARGVDVPSKKQTRGYSNIFLGGSLEGGSSGEDFKEKNVKYIPQDLTPAQKEIARRNIGALDGFKAQTDGTMNGDGTAVNPLSAQPAIEEANAHAQELVSREESERIAGDQSLEDSIGQNAQAIETNAADIEANAEAIAGEIQRAIASERENADLIESEATRATSAEQALTGQISDEATARSSADTTLQSNIEAEASARAGADSTLQAAINAEGASRQHEDAVLHDLLADEATAREEADEALREDVDGKINISAVPLGTSGPTNNKRTLLQAITIDSTSASSAIISGWSTDVESDGAADIETQVAMPIASDTSAGLMPAADHSQIGNNTAAIDAEITRATAAENDLQNAIDAEASARAAAVSGEATARAAAVSGEATARQGADTTLQGNITAEATARASADTTLQGNIDAEVSRATTAESTLYSNKLNKTDVIDNLTSSSATQALSANMGRELKSQLDTVAENGQNRGTFASIAELPTPNSGDYAYLSDISAADAANTSVFPNGAAAGDTWRVDEANPSGDGTTFVWIATIKVSEAQRDFTAEPIQSTELAAGAATDANIGTRTLTDAAADSTLVPVSAKTLTAWLQGIRNNLKALLVFMSRAAGFATSAQGTKADSAVQDASYVHTDNNYTSADKSKLAGIEAGAQVNIKTDWNAAAGAPNELLNKPIIPSGAAQATNATLGTVKGSTSDGQCYVETDGTMSLVGYDALTTGLSNANTAITNKVDKVSGKGLSTNDYTTADKNKLAGLPSVPQNLQSSEVDGQIYIETDQKMSVNGWDAVKSALNALTSWFTGDGKAKAIDDDTVSTSKIVDANITTAKLSSVAQTNTASSQTLSFGGTFTTVTPSYNDKGQITGKDTKTITMPAAPPALQAGTGTSISNNVISAGLLKASSAITSGTYSPAINTRNYLTAAITGALTVSLPATTTGTAVGEEISVIVSIGEGGTVNLGTEHYYNASQPELAEGKTYELIYSTIKASGAAGTVWAAGALEIS